MTEFVFRSTKPDTDRRACKDCLHLRAAVSLWCTEDKATQHRGTKIPEAIGCTFWKPARMVEQLSFRERFRIWFDELTSGFIVEN